MRKTDLHLTRRGIVLGVAEPEDEISIQMDQKAFCF
jgi:hypothetical protein